jgi:hypothetical protein
VLFTLLDAPRLPGAGAPAQERSEGRFRSSRGVGRRRAYERPVPRVSPHTGDQAAAASLRSGDPRRR